VIGRRVCVSVAGLLLCLGMARPADAQIAKTLGKESDPPPRQFTVGGGVSLTSGEESTEGFNATVFLVEPIKLKFRVVSDLAKQFSKITRPHTELVDDHSYAAAGVEYDFARHLAALARSEYEHNYSLGVNSNFTQRLGAGFRLEHKPTKLFFLLAADFSINDESLETHAHPEGWKTGYGFFQRANMDLSKKLKITDRLEYKREIAKPVNELEFQGTLAVSVTRSVGVQVQFNFEYESALGGSHKKHYEDSTQIGLVYRLGGS